MSDRIEVAENVTVDAQPSEQALKALASQGFRSVLNLRHDGEDQMPLSPDREGELASRTGLTYVHVPVSMSDADAATVERFRAQLANAPKPALVHCKLGQRAGAFVMMDRAAREGLSGDAALEQARALGVAIESPKLADFVRAYLDQR